jgi:hypothetical protein
MPMEIPRSQLIMRRIFLLQLFAGLWMFAIGLFIVPLLPHIQMDAVLSPAELQDDAKFEYTLSLLQREVPFYMAAWMLMGAFVIGTSLVGHRLCRPPSNPAQDAK